MRPRIKKLYIFLVKTFLPLLVMSFTISWFVVVMQMLWRFVDELVGKGIEPIFFLKMMFYAAMSVVNLALILAILIASLMTFGNLGERLELLAMKAAGIPLYKIMKPIFYTVLALAIGLFVFQNDWMIQSQVKFWTYYFSIRNKSPELAIPEGAFYKDLPGYSIYVKHKDQKTKIMHDVMIYDFNEGFANATVIVADSGKIYSTKDNSALVLELYYGESFKNLRRASYNDPQELIPYLREKFDYKEVHIVFDANLNMMDESLLSSQFVGKNMFELKAYTDSVKLEVDSMENAALADIRARSYLRHFVDPIDLSAQGSALSDNLSPEQRKLQESADRRAAELQSREGSELSHRDLDSVQRIFANADDPSMAMTDEELLARDSLALAMADTERPDGSEVKPQVVEEPSEPSPAVDVPSIDDRLLHMGLQDKANLFSASSDEIESIQSENFFYRNVREETVRVMRQNQVEYWRKFTYPVACILFFFIGAPLGAIIRKGGLGMPTVVAVLFFIVYYVLDSTGVKMAREDEWQMWFGMWMPTLVLLPISIWLTIIATKDSTKVNVDNYLNAMRRIFGTSTSRKIDFKEVVMVQADYDKGLEQMGRVEQLARQLKAMGRLNYFQFFMNDDSYGLRDELFHELEALVANLNNSRDLLLVHKLGSYPFLRDLTRTMRMKKKWMNILLMVFFPFGLIIYGIYAYRNTAYQRELKNILDTNIEVEKEINRVVNHLALN